MVWYVFLLSRRARHSSREVKQHIFTLVSKGLLAFQQWVAWDRTLKSIQILFCPADCCHSHSLRVRTEGGCISEVLFSFNCEPQPLPHLFFLFHPSRFSAFSGIHLWWWILPWTPASTFHATFMMHSAKEPHYKQLRVKSWEIHDFKRHYAGLIEQQKIFVRRVCVF